MGAKTVKKLPTSVRREIGPRQYMEAVRDVLEPGLLGVAIAGLYMEAIAEKNVGVLKIFTPYVLGAPPSGVGESVGAGDAVKLVIEAMRAGEKKKEEKREIGDEDSVFSFEGSEQVG